MLHSLDFGGLRYTAEVPLNVQCVRVVLLKDHYQVVQHGDAPVKSQITQRLFFRNKITEGLIILRQVPGSSLNP